MQKRASSLRLAAMVLTIWPTLPRWIMPKERPSLDAENGSHDPLDGGV